MTISTMQDDDVALRFSYLEGYPLTAAARQADIESRDQIALAYWQTHPRICFFLNTPRHGRLLDMGCGSGGLAHARQTYHPRRDDIVMLGVDIATGDHQHLYEKVIIGDFDKTPIDFSDNSVDAVLASHFFEHIQDTSKYFSEMLRILQPGGQMYIEIPSDHTKKLPNCSVLQDQGLEVISSNFYEDETHVDTYSPETLREMCESSGFIPIAGGYITAPGTADQALAYGQANADSELSVYGMWSKTLWAHYIIVRKPNDFDAVLPKLRQAAAGNE